MLKQYSWVLNIVFILFVSFFASKIVNVYLAKTLEVKRSIGVLKTAAAPEDFNAAKDLGDFDVIAERNIFDSSESAQAGEETAGAEGDVNYIPGGEAVKTGLSIKVMAVLVIGEGKDKRSSATVDGGSGAGIDVYGVGDEKSFASGVRLIQVKPDRIEFVRNGRLEYAELIEESGESIFGLPKPLEGAVASKTASPSPSETVNKVSEGKFAIDQTEIDNAIQNLDKLYTEIRAIPNFQDGKAAGMKILSVKPGSVFSKLGLKRGDVLQRINGIDLDVRKGFEIFSQLKDQKSLTLDLIRGGGNQTVEYEIR